MTQGKKAGLNTVYEVPGKVRVRTVLASVYDKTGLEPLFQELFRINPALKVYSTGGTLSVLAHAFPAKRGSLFQVEELTGNPEIQGGLVKTLDYKIYLGLLTEPFNESHHRSMKEYGVPAIDLVVVNLYPFAAVASTADGDLERSRANIDIGGPTMVRAGAKNFHRVSVLCRPEDYEGFLAAVEASGGATTLELRFRLARIAFQLIRDYDTAVDRYLGDADCGSLGVYTIREGTDG